MAYNFNKIEKKWMKAWEDKKIFEVNEKSKKEKYYVLDMFPYPSGEGLHMGHAFTFSLGDIYARFKRLQGYNVLYPVGYDALGLPAENASIKAKTTPQEYTKKSIKNFMKQQKAMGWSYDWSRLVNTSDSSYYKWEQFMFLKMLKEGIAYKKKSSVNWCKKCNTVLANEQVVNGKCWRHENTDVELKQLEQWYLKTTKYADELLDGLDNLEWSDRAKKVQKNWIGKSYGTEIDFEISGSKEKWPIFTTRPDTIYGVTFMVVSAQHSNLYDLVTKEQEKEVDAFLGKLKSVSEKELESMEKEGVFTGSYAVNPVTNEKIPVYAGNFVVADYGSGMVMAVPAHDQRDFEFAKKYGIDIKVVIDPKDFELDSENIAEAYSGEGSLINSGEFDGLDNREAKEKITKFLKRKKMGDKKVQFKLRDWLFSRQRYWGTPIPIIYCDECGTVPVSEKDLPVELPKKVTFGKGNPLETSEKWINVKCPKCNGKARRETDTMDTFINSSWYYLRYCDPNNDKAIFDKKKVDYWCPIDQYIGGPEHITMHLIYARFFAKFLRDAGFVGFDEPAPRYFTQGIVKGSDGEKMSKSGGNSVEPLDTINKFGADSLRLYLMSGTSPENDFDWDEKGIDGSSKFLKKVYSYFEKFNPGKSDARVLSKLNKAIVAITKDVENFKHNLAIIKLRGLFGEFSKGIDKKTAEAFLTMLSVYCPYICEELWEKIGNKPFIALASWPKEDERKIDDSFDKQDEAVEKIVSDIVNVLKIVESRGEAKEKVFVYTLPNEKEFYSSSILSKKVGRPVEVYAVNDKKKYDPANKSKSAKPGKPGIYLE